MPDASRPPSAEFPPADFDAWTALVEQSLGANALERRLTTQTPEGIGVRPLYTEHDARAAGAGERIGFPGVAPYVRGSEAVGRAGSRRDARAPISNPDPECARVELERDLAHGARSIWLRLDRRSRLGRDDAPGPDDTPRAGVPCASAAGLGALLANVALDQVPIALDAGANALPAAAVLLAVARARGVAPSTLSGTLCADPLGALAADGSLACSLDRTRAQFTVVARFTSEHAPALRAACVSTLPHHEAGAHAAQELAYALATGVAYLRWLTEAGLSIDAAAAQISFRVAVAGDVFMEVAKLRALRWLWAEAVRMAGGNEEARRAPVHAVTSARARTARDPWVNMLRETTEAFAAVVGGADAVTTTGFDARWREPDSFARRMALNAQIILDEEAHVAEVADPGGGSAYVEALTDALARAGWERFREIERDGGMLDALVSGRIAGEIEAVAEKRQSATATRKQPITGVSEFAYVRETPLAAARGAGGPREAVQAAATRAKGSDAALEALARANERLQFEAALEAALAGASLVAITGALAGGDAPPSQRPLPVRRDAADYERLRDASDRHLARTGARPRVLLAGIGPIADHATRADFATTLLAAGGIEAVASENTERAEQLKAVLAEAGAEVVCLCGTDAAYAQSAPALARDLRVAGARHVILAGRPREHEKAYRDAGVDAFVHAGCNVVAALASLHAALGVEP